MQGLSGFKFAGQCSAGGFAQNAQPSPDLVTRQKPYQQLASFQAGREAPSHCSARNQEQFLQAVLRLSQQQEFFGKHISRSKMAKGN